MDVDQSNYGLVGGGRSPPPFFFCPSFPLPWFLAAPQQVNGDRCRPPISKVLSQQRKDVGSVQPFLLSRKYVITQLPSHFPP